MDEPAEWHAANLAANSSHYALLPRLLGGSYVMAVAQRVGVGVHFNPCVPLSCIGPRADTHTIPVIDPHTYLPLHVDPHWALPMRGSKKTRIPDRCRRSCL